MKKTGVLLIQLGTPDSPKTKDVRRYLKEFLNDPRVIDLPWLPRTLLVNGIIVPFRAPKSAKIYRELWEMSNDQSPLLVNSQNAVTKLKDRFSSDDGIDFYLAMRYQNPSLDQVLDEMRKKNYDKIVVLPLFPQYASASSGSAIEKALNIIRKWWVIPEIEVINQFYDSEGYIDSIVDRAKEFDLKEFDKIMFSYHGLPDRHVDKVYDTGLCSDQPCETELNELNKFCYKATCYETTRLIAKRMGLTEDQYTVSFQSRLDKKWLTPFSDQVIEDWAKEGAKKILVFSPAFVADCLETLVEIGVEYHEDFQKMGGELVQLVPSSNDHPRFIDSLESLIRQRI
jgi:ferrochelatase